MAVAEITEKKKIKFDEKMITDSASSSSSSSSLSLSSTGEKRLKTEFVCSWSDLPIDMVRNILGKLALTDRIRARYVCKNWLPVNEIPTSSTYEIPWLMSFQNNTQGLSNRCTLYEPFYKTQKPYTTLEDDGGFEIHDHRFLNATIVASKNGWVMFYHRSITTIHSYRNGLVPDTKFESESSFFLYNPFTKNTINLPYLNTVSSNYGGSTFDLATFSSSPDEDDCVFFVLEKGDPRKKLITTYCCSVEEQKWKINQFIDDNDEWRLSKYDRYEGSVYIDGTFYCVSRFGTLASFNVALYEWNYLTKLFSIPIFKKEKAYIVESNGEILLVYKIFNQVITKLYSFDKDNKAWVCMEKSCLKDKALFLGSHGSFAVSVTDDGDPNKIANKFYFFNNAIVSVCYSGNGEDSEEVYDNIPWDGTTKIWIQPPLSSSSLLLQFGSNIL